MGNALEESIKHEENLPLISFRKHIPLSYAKRYFYQTPHKALESSQIENDFEKGLWCLATWVDDDQFPWIAQ